MGTMQQEIYEIEHHLHSYECWFGKAVTVNAELHVADVIGADNGSFQLDAGNDDWGAWVQILGSSDTPCRAGNAYFDLNALQFTASERTARYDVQIAFGTSGAQALTDLTYTMAPYMAQGVGGSPQKHQIQSKRHASGTKVWARCKCKGQNTGTLDFLIGLHEYPTDPTDTIQSATLSDTERQEIRNTIFNTVTEYINEAGASAYAKFGAMVSAIFSTIKQRTKAKV